MAAAAGGGAEIPEDNTLVWAFDRLLDCELVSAGALRDHVLPAVAAVPGNLPAPTRAKLCLRLLDEDVKLGRLDETTLKFLQELSACEVPPRAQPSVELLLKVRTELGIQTFRPPPTGQQRLSAEQAEAVLDELFQGPNTHEEYGRYEQLRGALRDPSHAAALEAAFPFHQTLIALTKFIMTATAALPPNILLCVQEDLEAGRYVIGEGNVYAPAGKTLQAPPAARAAAAPVAPAAAAPGLPARQQPSPARHQPPQAQQPHRQRQASPAAARRGVLVPPPPPAPEEDGMLPPMGMNDEYEYDSPRQLPPRQQQAARESVGRGWPQRDPPAVVQQLHAELDNLAQQGGQDPLPEMLGQAALAAEQQQQAAAGGSRGGGGYDVRAAAAAAGAGAGGSGRQVVWDSPAVEHPAPHMDRVQYQRHSPLVQPSPARQQRGRASAAAAQQSDRGHGRQQQQEGSEQGQARAGANARRKTRFWSPEEIAELVRLVKLFGQGSWSAIHQEGRHVFDACRTKVDLKDKWRNLKKHSITPAEMEEIEAREAVLKQELEVPGTRQPGRPPKFAPSPSPKRRRVQAGEAGTFPRRRLRRRISDGGHGEDQEGDEGSEGEDRVEDADRDEADEDQTDETEHDRQEQQRQQEEAAEEEEEARRQREEDEDEEPDADADAEREGNEEEADEEEGGAEDGGEEQEDAAAAGEEEEDEEAPAAEGGGGGAEGQAQAEHRKGLRELKALIT